MGSMLYLLLAKKKCKVCKRLSHKDVLFCWYCGCSFDLRICASGHRNPPWVQFCLTCGKDRSLMSKPHSSEDLSYIKHATKPSTYIPGKKRPHYLLGLPLVCLGIGILWYVALMVSTMLPSRMRRVPMLIKGREERLGQEFPRMVGMSLKVGKNYHAGSESNNANQQPEWI